MLIHCCLLFRNTLQLLVDEVESTKKTYEEIQLDHNRYLHDIDARFRKHTSELDEIARIANRYATTVEAQKSRAEFFKAKADEQKQVLMQSVLQTQRGIPEDTNSSNPPTVQKHSTAISDESTETELTDHCLKADRQKVLRYTVVPMMTNFVFSWRSFSISNSN